jgi:hypothetical protein
MPKAFGPADSLGPYFCNLLFVPNRTKVSFELIVWSNRIGSKILPFVLTLNNFVLINLTRFIECAVWRIGKTKHLRLAKIGL